MAKKYKYKDQEVSFRELAKLANIPYGTLNSRINTLKWDVETAVDTGLVSSWGYKKIKRKQTIATR